MFAWDDLRYLAAFARHRSLSAAARQLKVDHVTVARRIAALEDALKLKLVDRRQRSYRLTGDGERIVAQASAMETAAFAVERTARGRQPEPAGEVVLSAPPGLASLLIAPQLATLRTRHPGIRLRLVGEKRTASLTRREADIALRLSRPSERDLVIRKVGALTFGLYASPGYLASHAPPAFEFIDYDDSLTAAPQQVWLQAFAGTRPIVLRASDIESHRAAARAGVGIAALPRYLGDVDEGLRRIDVASAPATRDVFIVVHRDLARAPLVRPVLDFVADCLKVLRPTGPRRTS
jgi:DNA-binding transcriptional LysR family regulator